MNAYEYIKHIYTRPNIYINNLKGNTREVTIKCDGDLFFFDKLEKADKQHRQFQNNLLKCLDIVHIKDNDTLICDFQNIEHVVEESGKLFRINEVCNGISDNSFSSRPWNSDYVNVVSDVLHQNIKKKEEDISKIKGIDELVYVYFHSTLDTWTRDSAIDYYCESVIKSVGEERDRYMNICVGVMSGDKYIFDSIDEKDINDSINYVIDQKRKELGLLTYSDVLMDKYSGLGEAMVQNSNITHVPSPKFSDEERDFQAWMNAHGIKNMCDLSQFVGQDYKIKYTDPKTGEVYVPFKWKEDIDKNEPYDPGKSAKAVACGEVSKGIHDKEER